MDIRLTRPQIETLLDIHRATTSAPRLSLQVEPSSFDDVVLVTFRDEDRVGGDTTGGEWLVGEDGGKVKVGK